MALTPLGLLKPAATEAFNVSHANDNMDLLDTLIGALQTGLAAAQKHKLTADTGRVIRNATDCNAEIVTGIYGITTTTLNTAVASTNALLWVLDREGSIIYQVAFYSASVPMYLRYSVNGGAAWSSWVSIPTSVQMALKLDASAYTAADVLTKIKTVDGAGSGLDADTLDGIQATGFALVDHVHADLVAAINAKQATITGAASSITSADLTASRAVVSDASGKIAISAVTAAELAYLTGLTSNVQTQINSKQATITGAATSVVSSNLTASRAMVSDASGKIAVSAVTAAELAYLTGLTANVQTQLDGKQSTITGAATSIVTSNLTASRALVSDGSGKVAVSSITAVELGYLSGASSNLQAQINGKLATDGTAANALKIAGRTIFVQSTTPTGVDGDIWFKPAA